MKRVQSSGFLSKRYMMIRYVNSAGQIKKLYIRVRYA